MKFSKIAISLVSVFTLASTSMAAEAKKTKSYKAPYGMAGCGFGATLIEKDDMLPQFGAWFLNTVSGNQTFGITSGTSNCVEGKSESTAMEQEVFIHNNFASLSKEAAQGQGETLASFAEMMGCSAVYSNFSGLSQNAYGQLFNSNSPEAVLANYRQAIAADSVLAGSCVRG